MSQSGSQHGQQPEYLVESDWKLGKALFLAVALLVKIPEERYEENRGKQKTNLVHAYKKDVGRKKLRKK